MKQLKQWMLAAILMLCGLSQNVWAQFPEAYLPDEVRNSYLGYVGAPPSKTSGAFMDDFYYYQWALEVRKDPEVAALAILAEKQELYEVFSDVTDITLSYEETPEILLLAESATTDAHKANKTVKNIYKRMRPFVTFNDPSLIPETDEEEATSYSYPSGHSTRGYMFAMALATIMPDFTETLMQVAQSYALNRVICGHHWKSDINASLLLAAGLFPAVSSTDAYQVQLKKAREEYQRVRQAAGVSTVRIVEHPATSRAYTIGGQPAADSAKGVVIHDGQKTARR